MFLPDIQIQTRLTLLQSLSAEGVTEQSVKPTWQVEQACMPTTGKMSTLPCSTSENQCLYLSIMQP